MTRDEALEILGLDSGVSLTEQMLWLEYTIAFLVKLRLLDNIKDRQSHLLMVLPIFILGNRLYLPALRKPHAVVTLPFGSTGKGPSGP